MANPKSLQRPPAGERYDPTAIDATGATLGQVLTAVTDGSGGQRSGWEDAPDSSGGDPGVGVGTPGNWSHAFVTEAGGTFVLGAHDSAAEDLPTGYYRRTLLAGSYLRGQATVAVAGAVTAYLDLKYSTDDGSSWSSGVIGIAVPLKAVKHAVGFAIVVPGAAEGDVLLKAVVVAGNATAVPEIRNFIIESTSVEPPPADGEGGPVTPGVPAAGLFAVWELTEGSGQVVANKSPGVGTADLILGDTTSTDGRDPVWTASPRRLATGGFGAGDHHYCHYDSIPALAAGCAIFFYADITTLGGLAKYFCGVENGGSQDHHIAIDGSNHAFVQVTENTGGGVTRTATGTTSIVNGSKHVFGIVHDGTNLKVYVDPVSGLPEGTTACSAALDVATPRKFVLGQSRTPPSLGGGPDACYFGDCYFHAGASVASLTADDIAALYQQFKLTYTALP